MDTAIIIGVGIGSVVALVLVFGKMVLGVIWTGNGKKEHEIIQTRNLNVAAREHLVSTYNRNSILSKQNEDNKKYVQIKARSDAQIETKSKSRSRTAVKFKRSCNLNELISKRVKTSDLIEVGNVIAIDNQSMTVLSCNKQHTYVIPDYYIREYDRDSVLIDTSIQYLYHYEINVKPQQIRI
ncbi:MAG TPA: hypothetical protein VH500_16305 [Nitrososphaeraceae archaeon]